MFLRSPVSIGNAVGVAGITLALSLFASGAQAQNCTGFADPMIPNLAQVVGMPAGAASAVAGSLGNLSTAFFTQQTSAFVAGATSTQPDQASGGIWARAVGGQVDTKSDTSGVATVTRQVDGTGVAQAVGSCASKVRQTYWGFQAGKDLMRLNLNGWNLAVGATAGYLEAHGEDIAPGSISSEFRVPFIGGYAVATHGSFFSDVMVRREFYNVSLNQPGLNLFNQPFGARGWSISLGAGYNLAFQDGWFFEPSAGFIWSNTAVDAVTFGGLPANPIAGTLAINDIQSKIGRATARVGRNFTANGVAWQPFVSASVFHEFAPNVASTAVTCTDCVVRAGELVTVAVPLETTRVGTYGQYSLGLAAQVIDSGWVGFVRGDYRNGSNIEGWGLNGGLRYNFVPERPMVIGKAIVKAPKLAVAPYYWSGLYIGGHFGASQGRGHLDFVGTGVSVDPYIGGYVVGGQVGYNLQNGAHVVGLEAEISNTNTEGASACGTSAGSFSPLFLTCQNRFDWIATAAVRLGFTAPWSDRTLFYVKGGGAWANESVTTGCIFGPNNNPLLVPACRNTLGLPTNGFVGSDHKFGGLIGVGTEFGLTRNWSAKGEITYIGFANRDITASDGTPISIGAGIAQAKIGVNYHFANH